MLSAHQIRDGETRGVIREGDEVRAPLPSRYGYGAPDIGVYLSHQRSSVLVD